MPFTALMLVLLSAVSHASWNLAVKGSREKYAFTWWMMAVGFICSVPAVFLLPVRFTAVSVGLVIVSGLGEAVYLLALSASYHRLDYSVAYPIARGSAPVFIALGAAVALAERVSSLGLAGILLVCGGILALYGSLRQPGAGDGTGVAFTQRRSWHVLYPLVTGASIAIFSVADKAAVRYFSPLALGCLSFGVCSLFFLPYVLLVRRIDLAEEFRWHWRRILLVAFFCLGGYALVLAAMRIAPVSYVGAARESSVLFAAVLGWALLHEGFGMRRLLAAGLIFAGIVCLALAK